LRNISKILRSKVSQHGEPATESLAGKFTLGMPRRNALFAATLFGLGALSFRLAGDVFHGVCWRCRLEVVRDYTLLTD